MKRFYKMTSVEKTADGFKIMLDGRSVKTKSGRFLLAPNEGIAHAIMQEWAAQGELIKPDTMPLTQIINTCLDRVSVERAAMERNIIKYLDTDLLCYRADNPKELAERQDLLWQCWLDWFEKRFLSKLQVTSGLAALKQLPEAHLAVSDYVGALPDDVFTVLQIVTSLSGSLVLGLAFIERAVTPEQVFLAMYVEEQFKEELYDAGKYGSDPLLAKAQAAARIDLEGCAVYLSLLRTAH